MRIDHFRKNLSNQFSLKKDLTGAVLFFCGYVWGWRGVGGGVCGMVSFPSLQGRVVTCSGGSFLMILNV